MRGLFATVANMTQARHRRRRFQFRLATLLCVMFLFALAASAYGNRTRALQRQEQAFTQIAMKGGEIHINRQSGACKVLFQPEGDWSCGLCRVIAPQQFVDHFTDADLKLLDHILRLKRVDFNGSSVSTEAKRSFRNQHPNCEVHP